MSATSPPPPPRPAVRPAAAVAMQQPRPPRMIVGIRPQPRPLTRQTSAAQTATQPPDTRGGRISSTADILGTFPPALAPAELAAETNRMIADARRAKAERHASPAPSFDTKAPAATSPVPSPPCAPPVPSSPNNAPTPGPPTSGPGWRLPPDGDPIQGDNWGPPGHVYADYRAWNAARQAALDAARVRADFLRNHR